MGLAALLLAAASPTCDRFGPRLDCGFVGMQQGECEAKGCCWNEANFGAGAPHIDLPWCFKSNADASAYRVTQLEQAEGGSVRATLELSHGTHAELGADIKSLRFSADALAPGVLRLHLTNAAAPRWQVPTWLFRSELLPGADRPTRGAAPAEARAGGPGGGGGDKPQMQLTVREEPFSMEVVRAAAAPGQRRGGADVNAAGDTLFNSTGTRLVFKDQYLELSTSLSPSATLFGAGERASDNLHLERNGMPRTVWTRDSGPTLMEWNGYGSHPVVLALEEDGTAWGLLLLSSNGMEVVPAEDRLSWRVIGGELDLLILAGPSPLDVIDQLTAVVGRPAMMPRWALGWHQCKYGYTSIWEVEAVVANYSAAGLPLEAMWTDIDHLDGWRDFTFDKQNYPLPEFQRFVERLHSNGQRWVPIVDPGIAIDPGYAPYDEGLQQGVFLKGVDGRPYFGWVWPGPVHFPDFLHPGTQPWWEAQLKRYRDMAAWDGIWIDMNEISNFCTGDVCYLRPKAAPEPQRTPSSAHLGDEPPWVCQLDCREASGLNDTQRRWLQPPYAIANSLQRTDLAFKGVSMLASHVDGSVEYNAHQLYALSEARATAAAVESLAGKRPFVLTRSSFVGTGAYAAHWTGDNAASWQQLASSLPGVLGPGLWGIPMAGADICGFQGDTTPELCIRWVGVGAFYPFARDHSDLHGSYQELYRWPEVAAAGKKVLGMRYRLLPYLYTGLRNATATGAPLMRPLWLEFPQDRRTHKIDKQFMVGHALLVSPVLTQGADAVDAYFPPGVWHSLWATGEVVDAGTDGTTKRLPAPLGDVPLHMRGGTALWMQREALTTAAVARSPLTAVVALPELVPAPPAGRSVREGHGGGGTGGLAGGRDVGHAGGGPAVGAASPAARTLVVTGHMYHDGGEEPEVGNSLCHFVTLNATFSLDHATGAHAAELLLLFGSPAQLAAGAASGTSGAGICGPADDTATAAQHGGAVEWPELEGVEVLGWHAPVQGLSAEVVARADACGALQTVQRLPLSAAAAAPRPGGLRLDLSALRHQLECPFGLRRAVMAGLFASLVGSLGGKHLLPAVRSLPAADPDSSDDESVPLGLGLRSDVATGSSQKRRRVHHRGASPLASHGQGRPLFYNSSYNPLFENDEEGCDSRELNDENSLLPKHASGGTPVAAAAVGSEDPFTEFTPTVGPTCPLSAFLAELSSTPVLCALTRLEQCNLHPVGAEGFGTLEVTVAGMLVLCRRSSLGADEMCPEMLLTCLWLLMSIGSQYHAGLEYNSRTFLHLHPDGHDMLEGLKRSMVDLQLKVLQRCNWRVLLLDVAEVNAALHALGDRPAFDSVCSYVESCADHGWQPLGSHGHSQATAAAIAAADARDQRRGGGAAAHRPPSSVPRSCGSSRSEQTGLDGAYWRAAPATTARRARPQRAPLGPRNH
ncbi:alpha-xylosidase 1 [Micractinium conductrix]|uniref:alpha-glucosidase n=1 Tax=Micractinium conductrix TaxID=554055 RepID=A0A2P6V8K8_9CHLO|nr:alpha-xylosidase 1 [Micractinium conductrix]|eukprot:PSC70424.1 alpha-xylosidase 1 [Micractinium conductrix]